MPKPEKVATVAQLTESFREANAAVLTEYRGLSVSQITELRASIGPHANYAVVKNTLTKIAAKEAGVTAFDGQLTGPSALAFITGDPVEAARGLRDFARAHPALVIKAAVLDGKQLSPAEVNQLADLESREVLLAKLAGAMKASLSGAASLFQAPIAQAARAVEALRQKLESEGGAAAADEPGSDEAAAADEPAPDDTAAAEAGSSTDASTATPEASAESDAETPGGPSTDSPA